MREEGTERERNINWLPSLHAQIRDRTHNPSVCPNWKSNHQPFGAQDNVQPTGPLQPDPSKHFIYFNTYNFIVIPRDTNYYFQLFNGKVEVDEDKTFYRVYIIN